MGVVMISKLKWTKRMANRLVQLCKKHTYEQAAKTLSKEFKVKLTANAVRKANERYKVEVVPTKKISAPSGIKILVLDIETSPIEARVWGLFKQNIALNQIKEDWAVLSWAAKWYGDPEEEIMYMDNRDRRNPKDDKAILKKIWKLIDEADVLITQNGISFDIPKLNARFVMHGLGKPSSFKHFDTLRVARKHFKFTSNKQEWMTDKLCTRHKKSKHNKFPGFSLWDACLAGNKEAWKEMEHYNKEDVLSLEELASILLPWDSSINLSVFVDKHVCNCGSLNIKKQNSFFYTNSSKFEKYRCQDCGAQYRGKKNLLKNKLHHGI